MDDRQQRDLLQAREAEHFLRNTLWVEAFAALEEKYIRGWRNSQASNPEEREKVYWLITALDEVKGELTRHITTGKMVRQEIEQEAFRDEMLNDRGISLSYGGTDTARPEV